MNGRWLMIVPLPIAIHQMASAAIFSAVTERGAPIEVLSFFRLVEVWNRGISFGLFNNLAYGQWLLSGLAVAVVLYLLSLIRRADSKPTIIALCLIIGGALGNVIDRLRFGAVADYLDFYAFGYHWPAFNVTDATIFIGVSLLVICGHSSRQQDMGSVKNSIEQTLYERKAP